MKTLKFRCTLLSDVILNVSAATEGVNQTLDFIPGNNFLGIVASQLYGKVTAEAALDLFHNGTVRYGDAHPAAADDTMRSLKIPADLYYPKLKGMDGNLYVHHLYSREADPDKIQLKQCREGFLLFGDGGAQRRDVPRSCAVKSAHDKQQRRSKDKQMYTYESIVAGTSFLFSVETDKDEYADMLKGALVGTLHIGRSKTAQYGLVKIDECDFSEVQSRQVADDDVVVYADGRLIFIDEYGMPTCQPTASQLGIAGGEVDWQRSQVRIFQYAPWNGKRHTSDADRYGIEKGSVLIVKTATGEPASIAGSTYVGSYNHEGFGRVIYNPDFLKARPQTNGLAVCQLTPDDKKRDASGIVSNADTPLLQFLATCEDRQKKVGDIYDMVNRFVDNNNGLFRGDSFASQWGTIRSIAMRATSAKDLFYELFDKTRDKNGKTVADAYLTHGIAKDKWEARRRKDKLKKFIENAKETLAGDEYVIMAVVNLAAEMAKKCRKEQR